MKKALTTLILLFLALNAHAQWASRSDIENLCRKATTFDRDLPACLLQFKDHDLSKIALNVCYVSTTFDKDLDECAVKMLDYRFSSVSPQACKKITPFDRHQADCLYDLRELNITTSNLQICTDSSSGNGDKIKQCLLQISDRFQDDPTGPISDREIVAKIQRAIRLIDRNEVNSAKRALRNLIDDIQYGN